MDLSLNEFEQWIKCEIGGHSLVYCRFDGMETRSEYLLDAVKQIKSTVLAVQCGIARPEDHRAETFLLMLLSTAAISFHGFTPKKGAPK